MSGLKVRVTRNRYGPDRAEHPWLVACDWCAGGNEVGAIFAAMLGKGMKGWAPSWERAQEYAIGHALAHEATRCPTCLHVPTELLPSERKASA